MVGRPRSATSARQPDGCQAISAGGRDLPSTSAAGVSRQRLPRLERKQSLCGLWGRCSAGVPRVPPMAACFVLIHSPSVGPRTWQPVASRLTALGWEAAVPSLLHITDEGRRSGPRWSRRSAPRLGTAEQGQGLVLVAHSNAGLFIGHRRCHARPGARLHLRGRGTTTPIRCSTRRAARAAGVVAGQGIGWAAASLDRLVGRGGGGAAVPGPGDPPGGDRGGAEAAAGLLQGLGAGAHRLGCPAVRLSAVRTAL